MSLSGLKEIRLPPIPIVEADVSNIFFVIFTENAHEIVYRSDICTDLLSPRWSFSKTLTPISIEHSALKKFVFQFYLANNQGQKSFAMTVTINFSKLILLPPEVKISDNTYDLIILQFDDKNYFCVPPKPEFKSNFVQVVSPSSLNQQQKLGQQLRIQEELRLRNRQLLIEINAYKVQTDYSTDASCHTRPDYLTAYQLDQLNLRLKDVIDRSALGNASLADRRDRLNRIKSKRGRIQKALSELKEDAIGQHFRLVSLRRLADEKQLEVSDMERLLGHRRLVMTRELAAYFPIEVLGKVSPNSLSTLLTICGFLLLPIPAPGFTSQSAPSWVDLGNGTLAPSRVERGDGEEATQSQSLLALRLANRPATASAAVLHAACLVRLLAAILHIPLPFVLQGDLVCASDAFRPRICGSFLEPTAPAGTSYPLYAQRNNEDYSKAIGLLNMNIVFLRAAFNIPTRHPQATLQNLKGLLGYLLKHLYTEDREN